MTDWNLQVVKVNWLEMAIGVGFSVSTPKFKLRPSDTDFFRCLSLVIHLCGLHMCVTIPLWKDND